MTGALTTGLWIGIGGAAIIWPFAMLVRGTAQRWGVVATAVAGFIVGAAFALQPAAQRLPIETSLTKGGTAWAGVCLLLAVLEVTGLAELRRKYRALHLAIIYTLAATALPLSGIIFVRDVRSASFMSENAAPWGWAVLGLALSVVLGLAVANILTHYRIDRFVTMYAVLLVAPVLRLAVQPNIVPNLEAILSRVAHDTAHVLVMLVQLPDHVYLSNIVWTVIGLAFMKATGLLLNVAVYLGVVAFVVYRVTSHPLPIEEAETPAGRRARWASLKRRRRISFVPVVVASIAFCVFAYNAWAAAGTPVTPTPAPLPATGIDTATLQDGNLHTFTFGPAADKRLLALKKPDGSYVVCLDACMVCPPDGYAQLGSDLFCLYCGTPIPVDTVGQPGGCNPIPVKFSQRGARLVIDQAQAAVQWGQANQGK